MDKSSAQRVVAKACKADPLIGFLLYAHGQSLEDDLLHHEIPPPFCRRAL